MKLLSLIFVFIYFSEAKQTVGPNDVTPLFTSYQDYLGPKGINFYEFYKQTGYAGDGMTIHLADGGILDDHEDLYGQWITFYHQPLCEMEFIDCDGGTGNAGLLLAKNNSFGILGIANQAHLVSYSAGSWIALEVAGVNPGDIVIVNMAYGSVWAPQNWNGGYPLMCKQDCKYPIRSLISKGAIVVVITSWGDNNLDDYPECHNTDSLKDLISVANAIPGTGKRYPGSNYGSAPGIVNSWGKKLVSLGYGDLQNSTDRLRRYTTDLSGGATLVGGALALIQGYLKKTKNIYLNQEQMLKVIIETGNNAGLNQKIGRSIDLVKMLHYVNKHYGHRFYY